jgi:AcrR family transcriptional regulator
MAIEAHARRKPGRPARLSRDQVLASALALADAEGLAAVTMQRVARALRAEPMSLYRHIRNKDDLLDGLVDLVYAEIVLPSPDEPWRRAMRRRAISARDVLLDHPWAVSLMESRTHPGRANLDHHDAVVGNLFAAGFSATMAVRAYNLVDSYIYGFTLQEHQLPFESTQELGELAPEMLHAFPDGEYPNLVTVANELVAAGFRYADEFEYGLDLILDGIERDVAAGLLTRRAGARSGPASAAGQ